MSSLEKRQANRRGSTHGLRKCSDGISDTSSVGSFLDDTDREVSSLTDRAFRSLCIGEDAIYNDLEVSSPANQPKASAEKALQNKDLRMTCQESSSHGIQLEEAETKPEVASTFQHSSVGVAQEHVLKDESLSYISNGCMEAMWQQKRSASRVSSLIKAFSSGESYCDSGPPDTVKDKYQNFNNESWDKSALLSIQRELTEFSSGYHPNLKPGPLESYGNHFQAVAWMNKTELSKTKFKALNTNNHFCHSEFSPFQLWKDYNRFPFETDKSPGFVSAAEYPRWYDSPLYKELTATHRISSSPAEGRQFIQRKIEDVAASQCSRSTVIQKALAIEKRCESEIASNCPPWRNNNFVKNKLQSNRPSTVSPSNEKVHRPNSSLLYHSRHTYEAYHKVGSSDMSCRTTPFNITQLLTPVIPGRQETETSEILQFAQTPLLSECDNDLKAQSDVKQSRESYKSKASSLLFNLKDNRKRVKSTYSPTKFKCLEILDRNKQPSKQEGRESRLSETPGSKVSNQEHATVPGSWQVCNQIQQNYEISLFQTAEHQQNADRPHNNMTLVSPFGNTNCNIPQNNHPGLLTNRESENYEVLKKSGHCNIGGSPVGHINDNTRTFGIRPETENILSKAQLPTHLSADMSAKQTFCRKENAAHQNLKVGTNFVGTPSSGYLNNQATDNISWKRAEPDNMVTKEMVNNNGIKNVLPNKGDIAALIEMDKQRKATAKQYLPSATESFFMRKDTYINKLNENVNERWISKDKQIQDTKSSFQTGCTDQHILSKQVQDDYTTCQYSYDCQHNSLQKKASGTKGSEVTTHEKAEGCLQRKMKHATSDMDTAKDYSQRTNFLQSVEEKSRNNEASVAYQPYKYESNKQWHIATTENRHTKVEECMSTRLQQSEIKAEQRDESNYIYSLSRTSCIQQQSTAYSAKTSQRNWITEDRARTEEHTPTSQICHKQGDINKDLIMQNNNISQTRGDKFNINDILSVRDNEHAKRSRENKYSFNGRVGDLTNIENITSPVTSDVAEDIAAKTEPAKVRSRAQSDGNAHCKHEDTSYGHVRKEAYITKDMKERPEKDIFITNDTDKVTLRALSYKEKGQTKQEILTSKLKAHAQKEISAIKEKGLAKHSIPSRNPKQSTNVSNNKEQINQEVPSLQREISAEKWNHLFQDITYSSVPLYKEQRSQGKTEPNYESLTAEKEEFPSREIRSETNEFATEKDQIKQMVKSQEEKITEVDKKHGEVQKFVKNDVHCSNLQYRENLLSKPSKDYEKEQATNNVASEPILATCFSSSEESVVKKEDNTLSKLSTTYKEYSTSNHEEFVKAPTKNINDRTLNSFVSKATEQQSDDPTTEPIADTNTASLKFHNLAESTKSTNNTKKESPLALPKARELEIKSRQDKTPSGWMKDDIVAVEETVILTETANKQKLKTEQEREHLQHGASKNKTSVPEHLPKTSIQAYSKLNTEPQEEEKQDIQVEAVQRTKTNEDSFHQQHHNTDDDFTFNTLTLSQNAHASKDLGYHLNSGLNKPDSLKLHSTEENKYYSEQEPIIKKLHSENREVQETVCQLKIRHENQNQQMVRDGEETGNHNQQLQQDSERALDAEHHNQKAKESQEYIESTPKEKKLSTDDMRTFNSNGSMSLCNEREKSEDFLANITITSEDQQLSSHPDADKSVDVINPVPESHIIHIASKEDRSPTNEPVIYSICVSSKSEAVLEEEPMIFKISVSSLSDASIIPGPENQEKSPTQLSIEQVEKDNKETSDNKNKEGDFPESNENSNEVKLTSNNNTLKQETVVKKYDFSAREEKLNYYRSTEEDNISSSYESLSAKCGLSERDTNRLESEQKEQGKNQENIKDKNNTTNDTVDNVYVPAEKSTSANFTNKHFPEFRKSNSPKESFEFLKNAKETLEQQYSKHVSSNKNRIQDVSSDQELLMSKNVIVCEDAVNNQSAKRIMDDGNVQLNENKQVRQKVQTMETGQKGNGDDVINKNTEMVQVKCETDSQMTANMLMTYANISNMSSNHTSNDLPQPNSTISTNDCQIRIKTQNIGESLNIINYNTKSSTLACRTPEECKEDALTQEKVSEEPIQPGNNKALQKELVCKSKFPELLKSNEVNISRGIVSQKEFSNFTNELTKENSSGNQNPIKYATSVGNSVLTGPDISHMDKNDIKSRIKADAVSNRGVWSPNNVRENAQNTKPAKVTETGTKSSCASGMTDDGLERPENEKWIKGLTQKEREMKRNEVTLLNKDPETATSVIKGDKDAECESSEQEKNLKWAKAQPQAKKDNHLKQIVTDNTGKSTREKEIKADTGAFKESGDNITWDIENSKKVLRDKPGQLNKVYHPQKDLPERQGNTNTLKSNLQSKYPDALLTKQGGLFDKSEVTQQDKKTTRPEISALADYARLKVISAEDDTITEKDLLQKMNTYQKYKLSAGDLQKVHSPMSMGDTEQSKQLSVNRRSENSNATMTPSQVQEQQTHKIKDEILAGHHQCLTRAEIGAYPKVGTLVKSPEDRVYAVKDTESTREKTLTSHAQSNFKQSLTAKDNRYLKSHEVHQSRNSRANSYSVQAQIDSKNEPKPKQPVNANMVERNVYSQAQVSIEAELNNANSIIEASQTNEEVKADETSEELQYYIVNGLESETKPKNNFEPPSLSHNITSKKDVTETPATAPRSNTSSPATGKPIMFRVKDNTGKTSSVTKTVRPRFHRSFSEDFSIGSPVDSCFGSEKDKLENDHVNDLKESGNVPVLHEQAVSSHRFPSSKEIQARNRLLSPGFLAPKEPRSYSRRSHITEEAESQPVISPTSEDVESLAASSVVMNTEHIQHTYARPESSCYERPESACYGRPESACSDIRPASKPPAVPIKTEKALRRAKRLTSRRISKVEDKMASDTSVPTESKSIRTVSSLPASPMVQMSSTHSIQASPQISQYHGAHPAPSIVTHSFPMTQRKLLQDPNSGQIFMVDMPVQVKTKTFFDPETGKYLQLNVRQRAQSTLSQPASLEVLGQPYVVYPGFLPMSVSVSSVPSVRSSSQMSAPATLTEERNQPKARHEAGEQETFKLDRHRNAQQHNRAAYTTQEQTGREPLHNENVRMTPRQTHIITMSELEDFAVENT